MILSAKKSFFKTKLSKRIKNALIIIFLVALLISVFLINMVSYRINTINGIKHASLGDLFYMIFHWNTAFLDQLDYNSGLKSAILESSATIIAAISLAIAGAVSQSLTINPLADASTLGIIQTAIFGVLIALSWGIVNFFLQYIFAILGSLIAAILLYIIVSRTKYKSSSRIILMGLAIGIIFKTLSFIIKKGDLTLDATSYSLVLGGAEGVHKIQLNANYDLMVLFAMIATVIAIFLGIYNAKGMTVLELGSDKAKQLGVHPFLTKSISLIILVLTIPSAVLIVGNLAFVGLFATHLARWALKTRDYKKIILLASFIGAIITSIGYNLTIWIPSINSGLWTTFIGAPYMIYIGVKGVK